MTIDEVLNRGVADILPSKAGLKSLMEKQKITLYQGFDPTGTQLHIGHAVALRKLRQFQDLGHKVIFLIGDGTGQAGDPSGKTKARDKFFTKEELKKNAQDYKNQAGKILRFDGDNPVEIKYNSDWLNKLGLVEILDIAGQFSLQQLIERDLFQQRIKNKETINMREFLYPLLQGYDSVAMNVDLELGGTDQTFNMLAGRQLVKAMLNKEKYVLTVPLLTDANGTKIGKSEGNVIGLTDPPNEFYGKIMALGDDAVIPCFDLLTDISDEELKTINHNFSSEPLKYKKHLAFTLTEQFNSTSTAQSAQSHFESTFQQSSPDFSEEIEGKENLASTIAQTGLSISEAKRLISQSAVDVNNKTITDSNYTPVSGDKIKIGKRVFVRIK
jgi:tyrosyl-tRNA synthetase